MAQDNSSLFSMVQASEKVGHSLCVKGFFILTAFEQYLFFFLSQASVAVLTTVSQLLDANETEFNNNNLVNVTAR